ncbi:MAG: hypothetical protein J7J01_00480 [Methanophagales archaeon]|nr:hypothetical protein [Methanophagales archaeon]
MTTDTREKLLEARYFLEQMKERQSDQDAFKYNLSAFLAAARSVTLIMQKEFARLLALKIGTLRNSLRCKATRP